MPKAAAASRGLAVIGAIGAGRMGRGIAHAFATAGYEILLVDLKARTADAAAALEHATLAEIQGTLTSMAALGVFPRRDVREILSRVHFVPREDAPQALARIDVAFECISEIMSAKRAALTAACAYLPRHTIVSSTTSTFSVDDIARFVPAPERFLNGHWLNPAYLIPLVEVSPHKGTSAGTLRKYAELLRQIGKMPVLCRAAPGFIVPRLQTLMMLEAARIVEEGVATPEDVDRAVRFGFGFRYANMGPVEFIDYGGSDILFYASRYLTRKLGPRFRAPGVIGELMRSGECGMREGRGFYDWRPVDVQAYRRDMQKRMVAMLRHLQQQQAESVAGPRGRKSRPGPGA